MDIILFAGHLPIEFVAVALKVGLPKACRHGRDYHVFPSMTYAIILKKHNLRGGGARV